MGDVSDLDPNPLRRARVVETPDVDPRTDGGAARGDAGPLPNASSDDNNDEYDDTVFERDHITVREHRNDGAVVVEVADSTPTLVHAAELRDALNVLLDDGTSDAPAVGHIPNEDTADMSCTVEFDADVSSASDAIESLQADVEALTEELNEAAERAEDIDFGDLDYGLPAPSPSDVQERMGETDDSEMVPAGPLYEIAALLQSLPSETSENDDRGYNRGMIDAGWWIEDELNKHAEIPDDAEVKLEGLLDG
mgnify:CR=1 FL=1